MASNPRLSIPASANSPSPSRRCVAAWTFYSSALERGARSERALTPAIAQIYFQGVSTPRVTAVLEKLCGLDISSSQVSHAAASLDEELAKCRSRRLDAEAYPHLALDARYEKVRVDGAVISCAVRIAVGISAAGKRAARPPADLHWSLPPPRSSASASP